MKDHILLYIYKRPDLQEERKMNFFIRHTNGEKLQDTGYVQKGGMILKPILGPHEVLYTVHNKQHYLILVYKYNFKISCFTHIRKLILKT